jgi:ADP-ribosylglycohydrolase
MIGAIAGDIIGSVFEWKNVKTTDFELFARDSRFTDDTVLTVAVADCILYRGDYTKTMRAYGRRYPHAGYGERFRKWLFSDTPLPYNSFGNGSAMRVSPVGFAFPTIGEVLEHAGRSAEVTHNHPDGIRGAKAVAAAVFLARTGESKEEIKKFIEAQFMYDLDMTLDEIRPEYRFDPTCNGSVPQAIIAFLESEDYEDAVRKAISIGGDSDTIACITGGIAQAFYKKIPRHIFTRVRELLPADLLRIVAEFDLRYAVGS